MRKNHLSGKAAYAGIKRAVILFAAASLLLSGYGYRPSASGGREETKVIVGRKKAEERPETPENPEPSGKALIQPLIIHYYDSEGEYDEKTSEYHGIADESYDQVILDDEWAEKYPALQKTLREINESVEEDAWETYDGMIRDWHEMHDQGYGYDIPMTDERRLRIARADSEVFSVAGYSESYMGGAHGYYFYSGASFEPETGRQIELSDVICDEEGFREAVYEQLDDWYEDSLLMDEVRGYLDEYTLDRYTWMLGPQGVSVYFSPYEIGAYASGAPEVIILFDEYPELFTSKYQKTEDGFTVPVNEWQDLKLDITGDGRADSFMVYGERGDYETISSLHIVINGRDFSFDANDGWYEWYFGLTPMLVHTADGRWYLYLNCTSDNDWEQILIFDLNGRKPKIADIIDGGAAYLYDGADGKWGYHSVETPIVHPESFRLQTRLQTLSTLDGSKEFHTGDNGVPETKDTMWRIDSLKTLTLKEDTSFEIVTESGSGTGRKEQVKKDDILTLYRTDGEQIMDAKTQDGKIVRIVIDTDGGWPQRVSGFELEELFEGIMFAG